MAGSQDALATISGITGAIQLGLVVEGQVVPIIVGAVKSIKAFLNESGEVEFTVALAKGEADIQDGVKAFQDSLALINAERAKAGLDPIK